jgi:hypothetical protein
MLLCLSSKVVYQRSFRFIIWKLHQTRPVFFLIESGLCHFGLNGNTAEIISCRKHCPAHFICL